MNWTITSRLYSIVALSFGLFLALIGYGFTVTLEREIDQSKQFSLRLAKVVAGNLDHFAADTRQLLDYVVSRPAIRALDPKACDPLSTEFTKLHGNFVDLGTVDAQGEFVCTGISIPVEGPRPSVGTTQWFQQIKADPRPLFGKPYKGRLAQRWVFVAAAPILDDAGVFKGAVGLPVDIEHVHDTLRDLDLPEGAYITVIDGDGVIVARSLDPGNWVGKSMKGTPIVDAALATDEGTGKLVSASNQERIVGWAPVNQLGWKVIAGVPAEVVIAPAKANILKDGALLLMVITPVMLVTWWISRGIINPIQAMANAVEAMAGNRFETRLPAEGPAELAALARAFNEMTESRSEAYRSVRQSETKYRMLLESLPHRVFYKDRNSVYQAVNPSFARMFGRQPAEFIGCTDHEFQDSSRADYIQRLDREVMETGRTREFDEEFLVDDEIRIFHTLKAPVRDEGGAIVGLLGISWDITDRKRAENALTEATRNAEAASQAKSDFLANMSHEIRTPMNAVIGLAHLLGQTELDARQRDYVQKIRSSANSLLALLNDILDLSKVEAGKLELEHRPFRLDQQLRDLATILSTNAQDRDIEVLFRIDPQVPAELVGDSLRLQQILINLGGNAIKFTKHGEVVISVSALELSAERAVLRFSIRDTGIGINPEQRRRLFQAFNQGDSSTSRRYGGTGLGLVISCRLVRLMDGEIGVESEEGKGSEFHFTAVFGRTEPMVDKAETYKAVPRDLKVLIVDDNPTAREVMECLVSAFGWRADLASSGEAALDLVRHAGARPYDLVLLDWKMPGMDGLQTSRSIRAACDGGHPPIIIVVTAYGREVVARNAEASDMSGLLVKPVTASMLLDAVASAYAKTNDQVPRAVCAPADRPLPGVRLLVAEDNAINQQIASEMLAGAGATVVLAGNGREALDIFLKQPDGFDAILMDIQMPEMDGYAATRALRAMPEHNHLPIIAMTANAMASDREKCLAVGMNDHIPKPLEPDLLLQVVARWTLGAAAANAPPPATSAAPAQPAGLRVDGIDTAAALHRLGGREAVLLRILGDFERLAPSYADDCVAAFAAGDARAIEAAAHALKGMAGNVGAVGVQAAAGALEAAAREGDDASFGRCLAELRDTLAEVLAGIRAIPQAQSAGDAAHVTVGELAAGLTELRRLLADDNFAASDSFEALRPRLVARLGADAVAPLARAVHGLDFAAAVPLADTLAAQITSTATP